MQITDNGNNMRIRNLIAFAALVILFSTMIINRVIAQNCPPGYPSWEKEEFKGIIYDYYPLTGKSAGSIEFYHFQNQDGSYDVKIDWGFLLNSTEGYWNLTNEELKGLAYLGAISYLLNDCQKGNTKVINFYEIEECTVNHNCYLRAKQQQTVYCTDNLWPGPDPQTFLHQGEQLWLILWYESCGVKCCKKTFTVTCGDEIDRNRKYFTIDNYSTSEFIPCPPSGSNNCITNAPEDCWGICQ
jgi:hypothetical protein